MRYCALQGTVHQKENCLALAMCHIDFFSSHLVDALAVVIHNTLHAVKKKLAHVVYVLTGRNVVLNRNLDLEAFVSNRPKNGEV